LRGRVGRGRFRSLNEAIEIRNSRFRIWGGSLTRQRQLISAPMRKRTARGPLRARRCSPGWRPSPMISNQPRSQSRRRSPMCCELSRGSQVAGLPACQARVRRASACSTAPGRPHPPQSVSRPHIHRGGCGLAFLGADATAKSAQAFLKVRSAAIKNVSPEHGRPARIKLPRSVAGRRPRFKIIQATAGLCGRGGNL
jgi:hypothetical protein